MIELMKENSDHSVLIKVIFNNIQMKKNLSNHFVYCILLIFSEIQISSQLNSVPVIDFYLEFQETLNGGTDLNLFILLFLYPLEEEGL